MNLQTLKPTTLADKLGQAQSEYVKAKTQLDAIKAEVLRRKLTSGQGDSYSFTCPLTIQQRIDSAKLKAIFTDEYLDTFKKSVRSRQWHIHALVTKKASVSA